MRILDRYAIPIGAKLTFQQMFERCEQFMQENSLSSEGLFWHIHGNGASKTLSLFPELSSAFTVQYTPGGDVDTVASFRTDCPQFVYRDDVVRQLIAKVPRGLGGCGWVYAGFSRIAFFPHAQLPDGDLYCSPYSPDIPSLSSLQFNYDCVFPSERQIMLTVDVTGSDPAHPLDSSAYGQSLSAIVGKQYQYKREVVLSESEKCSYARMNASFQSQVERIQALCMDPQSRLAELGAAWNARYRANRERMVQLARRGEPLPPELLEAPVFSLTRALTKVLRPLGFQKLGYRSSVFFYRKIDAYNHAIPLIIDISPRHKTISACVDLTGLGFHHRFHLPQYQPLHQADAENWCQEFAAFLSGEFAAALDALSSQYPPSPAWLYSPQDSD